MEVENVDVRLRPVVLRAVVDDDLDEPVNNASCWLNNSFASSKAQFKRPFKFPQEHFPCAFTAELQRIRYHVSQRCSSFQFYGAS